MDRQPTLFMRIHKTAGEALAKQVLDRLPPASVCPHQFEWQVRSLSVPSLRRFSFFQGHISPSALSTTFAPLRAFTMLRAPRERLLSCFFYWKQASQRGKGDFFEAMAPMSLPEFLRSDNPIIRRATWNVQARLLAGGHFGGVDQQRQNVFGPWLPESDLVAEALNGVKRFAFVGVAEQYDVSLRRTYSLLGLGEPPAPEQINVTSSRPASYDELLADPEIADALSRLTRADQMVYDVVRQALVD